MIVMAMTAWGPPAVVVLLVLLTLGALWILPQSRRRRCVRCGAEARRIFVACPRCGRQLIGRTPGPHSRGGRQARSGGAG
jgi:predicted amidophosphoribosyltransferase